MSGFETASTTTRLALAARPLAYSGRETACNGRRPPQSRFLPRRAMGGIARSFTSSTWCATTWSFPSTTKRVTAGNAPENASARPSCLWHATPTGNSIQWLCLCSTSQRNLPRTEQCVGAGRAVQQTSSPRLAPVKVTYVTRRQEAASREDKGRANRGRGRYPVRD